MIQMRGAGGNAQIRGHSKTKSDDRVARHETYTVDVTGNRTMPLNVESPFATQWGTMSCPSMRDRLMVCRWVDVDADSLIPRSVLVWDRATHLSVRFHVLVRG